MAMITIPPTIVGLHVLGGTFTKPRTDGGYGNSLLDAAGEYWAVVFPVSQTGNIRTIRFRLGTVTSGQTLRAGVYTVDPATGLPTSTAYGGMAVGTVAVANNDDNTEKVITLATDAAATEGDIVAIKIEFDGSVGNLNINGWTGAGQSVPYTVLNGAKVNGGLPCIAVGYSDGSYPLIPGFVPWTGGYATTAVNSGTGTADEYSLRYALPFKHRLCGMAPVISSAAGADYEYINYDGTVAVAGMTGTRDGDIAGTTSGNSLILCWLAKEIVAANAIRRLAIRPTTANTVAFGRVSVGVHAALENVLGTLEFYTSRRLDQGPWSDLNTEFPMILPVIDGVDDGTGEGGSPPRSQLIVGGGRY